MAIFTARRVEDQRVLQNRPMFLFVSVYNMLTVERNGLLNEASEGLQDKGGDSFISTFVSVKLDKYIGSPRVGF
jgi:hypothetical protein